MILGLRARNYGCIPFSCTHDNCKTHLVSIANE